MRADIKTALEKNKEINRLFNTFGFKKNYERIENYLSEDETVLYIRNGNVKIDNSGELKESGFSIKDKTPVILAITDKRVLIYFRVLFDEKLEQIPIKEIRTFDFKRNGLTSSVFRITSLTKSVDLDLTCNADEVKLLNDTLLTLIK
ncbi:PH domain-containing protein [Tissierella sp. MSJ-40]|uniref:PH domain-containing protein n=1 Tax=Tissierella simiarum TaxID=2841534 RepID=A0ABS6E997_9FIRM|nr:PH domain-containing protein [Tissierella simiarum]